MDAMNHLLSPSRAHFIRRIAPVLLTLAVAVGALAAGRRIWLHYGQSPWTRDAHIRADVLKIAPDVAGLVTGVLVHDNQSVHRGDVLFQVDRSRYEIALSQARAALAQSRAVAEQARVNVVNQRASLRQAQREAQRNRRLSDLVAEETLEQGELKVNQAESALSVSVGALSASEANLIQAVNNVRMAELNLERTTVRSPFEGFVNDRVPHVGDYVSTGRPVLALVDTSAVYVDGYFEETKLDKVHVGDLVEIQIMGQSLMMRGRVQSIAAAIEDRDRASGANLLPNVNPSFNWVRLAQRIPVRISIDAWPEGQRPIVGRTATVSIIGEPEPRRPT